VDGVRTIVVRDAAIAIDELRRSRGAASRCRARRSSAHCSRPASVLLASSRIRRRRRPSVEE
jgi:hypothetical protein